MFGGKPSFSVEDVVSFITIHPGIYEPAKERIVKNLQAGAYDPDMVLIAFSRDFRDVSIEDAISFIRRFPEPDISRKERIIANVRSGISKPGRVVEILSRKFREVTVEDAISFVANHPGFSDKAKADTIEKIVCGDYDPNKVVCEYSKIDKSGEGSFNAAACSTPVIKPQMITQWVQSLVGIRPRL